MSVRLLKRALLGTPAKWADLDRTVIGKSRVSILTIAFASPQGLRYGHRLS